MEQSQLAWFFPTVLITVATRADLCNISNVSKPMQQCNELREGCIGI